MRPHEYDQENMAIRREKILNAAYRLFTERSITGVTFEDIAGEAGVGKRTVIRYFSSKPGLVIEVAVWKWKQVLGENPRRSPKENFEGMTALEVFEFYLDSFLVLYRNNRDLLRFNQLFNIYILSEGVDATTMQPYSAILAGLEKRFSLIYEKAAEDHTLRTDVSEEEMFSTTLHLMLAAVTRYAVGLVYRPENSFDPEKELEVLKDALLLKYRTFSDQ
jgi:AcrR family transcriptional regulator